MKITFILPTCSASPCGGFKVVYEYASRLKARGHRVTVVHPFIFNRENVSLISSLFFMASFYKNKFLSIFFPPWRWFAIDQRVEMTLIPAVRKHLVPDADAIVATSWRTAESIAALPEKKGEKFYFIQGLDTVFNQTNPERVMDTWKLPLDKIVISRWLENIAFNRGEKSTYIPNGLNLNEFAVDIPIEKRSPEKVCLIYNTVKFKGSSDGIQALKIVKEKYPQLQIEMFGVDPKPETAGLTAVKYHRNPKISEIRGIYNSCSIFIGTSWCEGFGLPPCEAAMCGDALCVSDNGGHREFAIQGKTALLHPPRRPEILAENIMHMLRDNEKRIKIAREANEYIKKFMWEKSVQEFERTIINGIAQEGRKN